MSVCTYDGMSVYPVSVCTYDGNYKTASFLVPCSDGSNACKPGLYMPPVLNYFSVVLTSIKNGTS